MSCLDARMISRAATTGVVDVHFGECTACRRELDAERELRARLQSIPVTPLAADRRRELAAELAALAIQPRRSWRVVGGVAAVIALAASALFVLWPRTTMQAEPIAIATTEPVAWHAAAVSHVEAAPRLAPPRIEAQHGARLSQQLGVDRDVVTLADGSIDVDTTYARPVDIKVGATIVRVDSAKVRVVAHQHAIVRVQVVVGAAHIVGADRRVLIERGSVWTAEDATAARSLRSFREAWIALRAGRNREAIDLFDAATDPAVAEEAAYWAAIATKRAGLDARERLSDFLRTFPSSPYAAQAKAMLGAE